MELVLLIGIQASRYPRQNQSRHAPNPESRRIIFQAFLQAKQPIVVDNTNPTKKDRAMYIIPVKEAGFKVIGYYFPSR